MDLTLSKGNHRFGAKPDLPDFRDKPARPMITRLAPPVLPATYTLASYLDAVKDQTTLGSCTGNAGGGVDEFLTNRWDTTRPKVPLSPLFLYYVERQIEGTLGQGDCGAQSRTIGKALNKYGCCPESDDPYNPVNYAKTPSAKDYTDALVYQSTHYHRLSNNVDSNKVCIYANYCQTIGFAVYESFESDQTATTGEMVMPQPGEPLLGYHEVYSFAYDDNHTCLDGSKGAFECRNSWNKSWGADGNFFMPYGYLNNASLVSDLWVIHLGVEMKAAR